MEDGETTTTPAPMLSDTPTTGTTPAPSVVPPTSGDVIRDLLARVKAEPIESGNDVSPLEVHSRPHIQITVAELKAAIAANPGHHTAVDFSKGVRNLPDTYSIIVERPDLEGLLTNKTVVVLKNVVAGETVVTKALQ